MSINKLLGYVMHTLFISSKRYTLIFLLTALFSSIFLAGCNDENNGSDKGGCNVEKGVSDGEISIPAENSILSNKIILFIGDGMGEAHRQAATYWLGDTLIMDEMPSYGYCRTCSADKDVTDSAAAATAIATGVKTNKGVIGMDPNLNALSTILEEAKIKGMSTGLITNVQMAHSTPAAFAAHVENRDMMTEIAEQMLASRVDVLLGGGEDHFIPMSENGCYAQKGHRTDGRNLLNEAIDLGYTYVCDESAFNAVDPSVTQRLIGLFADEGMLRPYSPTLEEMTRKAIDILSKNPNGFFLLIEGGQIDWASHSNEAENVISDVIDLDEAVAVAMAYAEDKSDTLIIVTADHETGGMSVDLNSSGWSDEDGPFLMPDGTPFFINWSTTDHTDADVPTTAKGPLSEALVGVHENTYIYDLMLKNIRNYFIKADDSKMVYGEW